MKKVIIINLAGMAYHLDEDAYEALRSYLDSASEKLSGNPDKDEIVSDLERAIAEKCDRFLNPGKTVVTGADVDTILKEMGPVQNQSAENESTRDDEKARQDPNAPKRLYRISEGSVIAGVCQGLAAYFNIDATVVRIIFIVLAIITGGSWILVYIVMMIIIPPANTSEEMAAAHGEPFNAESLIARAKAGYYDLYKKDWKKWEKEWKGNWRASKREMKENWRRDKRRTEEARRENWSHASEAGAFVAMPFLSLLNAFVSIIWLFALISLITTGMIFGFLLPPGLPLWLAIITLICLYQVLVWPLKAIRRGSYSYGLYGHGARGIFTAFDSLLWLAFVAFFLWLAYVHVPQAHVLLDDFGTWFQNATASLHH